MDINTFHASRGHVHDKSLRSTAKQLGGVLEASLRKREGCSVAKGLGTPIGCTTSTRADKVLLNLGSVVHSRNDTWTRLPPSVPVSAENVRSVSVSRKGRKLDSSRDGEVEMDEDVDRDESSEYTGVRPRVIARLVAPTPAAVPCGRAAPAGDRGTAAATSLRGAVMREIPGTPVHSSTGTPGGFAMSTPPVTSAGVRTSGGTVRPGASVELSPSVSEENAVYDSPSPKLRGRAAHELRWLGQVPVVRQERTRGERRQLDLDSAALFVEESACAPGMTVLPEAMACTTRCIEDLATSAMGFLPGMWLHPLPDSRNVYGAVVSESAFATADFDFSEFSRVS